MPTKLADTRTMTLAGAKAALEQIAHARCRTARKQARYEAAIARIKSEYETSVAADREEIGRLENQLRSYILANPDQFQDPRSIVTDFGKFGLRTVHNVEVDDIGTLVQWARDNGHLDVIRITQAPVLPALAKRLRTGQDIPGCRLNEGEEAFYAVDRALLDQVTADPT